LEGKRPKGGYGRIKDAIVFEGFDGEQQITKELE
jgi:hypothetical protein